MAKNQITVTIFTQLIVISITTLLLYWLIKLRGGFAFTSDDKMKIFNLHPLLMVVGFIVFSGEAMITYKAIPAMRPTLKIIHLIFHMIALASGILGVYVVFKYHNERSIPHMYTLHSWIGLSTICLFGLQMLVGIATFLFPGAESTTRERIAPWHVSFGVVIFSMAILSAEIGLTEKFIFQKLQEGHEALVVNFIGLLVLLLGIVVGLTVVLPLRKK
ncbi:cytochrome b561/ferric reductase transmembrane [Artemisia annua]|uniref:ascorbate ferrireductase (transmembrane) n=1 Tax=Artemisia annua TaxID=35608 RepID=A0A2U1MS79_ARTAN|nr:cytochrome b561/ferric reductase transmembrane [Artemisia annua]